LRATVVRELRVERAGQKLEDAGFAETAQSMRDSPLKQVNLVGDLQMKVGSAHQQLKEVQLMWDIPEASINLTKLLGSGEFSEVRPANVLVHKNNACTPARVPTRAHAHEYLHTYTYIQDTTSNPTTQIVYCAATSELFPSKCLDSF